MIRKERSSERLRAHFEVECELADRLRHAPAADRPSLYSQVYEELFCRVPDHPQLTRQDHPGERLKNASREAAVFAPFLTPASIFLEVGAGDGALSSTLAPQVKRAIALDVAAGVMCAVSASALVCPLLGQALAIPLAAESVDLVYSHQLIEHLHPDDAEVHLREVYRVLRLGGRYCCCTSSRFTGPHDISRFFTDEARGLHLREYGLETLTEVFHAAGFSNLTAVLWTRGMRIAVPVRVGIALERCLGRLPRWLRRQLPFRHLLEVRLVGERPLI